MTDSGGIQEEAAALNTPCLILRDETEWTRLVDAGKNIIVGTKEENIIKTALKLTDNNNLNKIKNIKIDIKKNVDKEIIQIIQKL